MKLGRLLHCWIFWVACVVITRGESWILKIEEEVQGILAPPAEKKQKLIEDEGQIFE